MKNPNMPNINPEIGSEKTDLETLMDKKIQDKLQQQVEEFVGDDLESLRDMKNYLDGRPTSGSYIETRTFEKADTPENENPLDKGLYEGDVFYSKSDDGSEIVYAVESTGEINDVVVYTLSETYSNGVEKKQIVTLEQAKAILAGKELIDGGHDRDNAILIEREQTQYAAANEAGGNKQTDTLEIKDQWKTQPDFIKAPAESGESRRAYPSQEEKEAAKAAAEAAKEAATTNATHNGELPTSSKTFTASEVDGSGTSSELDDDREKVTARRKGKFRKFLKRHLSRYFGPFNFEDDFKAGFGGSENDTKGNAPVKKSVVASRTKDEYKTRRKSKKEAKKAPEPTEADKAAAAAAVENVEIATDARGAGKPSDDEWGPGVPGDPIPGSPEVATSSSSFPEVEKAFAEAEKRVKEAEAKAQELEARQPEVAAAGEDGSILTPAGEQLLRDRVQAKREAEVEKGRLTMIKSMIERDQQNKREADYAQEAFAEAEKRVKEAEAKAQELEARQPEVAAAGEDGSILTPAGEQLLRDKASATLRAKEARDRADDLKVRVDSSARNLVTYRQVILEALN